MGAVAVSSEIVPFTNNPCPRADETGRTYRPITTVLELCLYRAATESCGGRILPFDVRQLIKDYAFVRFNNDTLREADERWHFNGTGTSTIGT